MGCRRESSRLLGLLARGATAQEGRAVDIGCNCGQKGTAKMNFVYVSPTGEKKVYKSEVEARAAQIRNGGGTYSTVRAA